jgi:hypothetical protein
MTKIEDDRAPLDKALGNLKNTLLVLSGSDATAAGAIHEVAQAKITEPWRKAFWVTNLELLTEEELASEHAKLFARGGRYALIGRCKGDDGRQHRVIVARGYHADLLDSGGEPDVIKIRRAFNNADKPRSC